MTLPTPDPRTRCQTPPARRGPADPAVVVVVLVLLVATVLGGVTGDPVAVATLLSAATAAAMRLARIVAPRRGPAV